VWVDAEEGWSMTSATKRPFDVKLMVISTPRPGAAPQQFQCDYESDVAPFIRGYLDRDIREGRVLYRRNFLAPMASELSPASLSADTPHIGRPFRLSGVTSPSPAGTRIARCAFRIGCVTELGFVHEEDYNRFAAIASNPEFLRRAEDHLSRHVAPGTPQARRVECWDSAGAVHGLYFDDVMAVKIFGFVPRKHGISREQLIHHYETSHTKLLEEAFASEVRAGSVVYRRNYPFPPTAPAVDGTTDFWASVGSVTEVAFRHLEGFEKFKRVCMDPKFIERRDADEERYKDPAGTLNYRVESCSR
jgi:hypothetical protein